MQHKDTKNCLKIMNYEFFYYLCPDVKTLKIFFYETEITFKKTTYDKKAVTLSFIGNTLVVENNHFQNK
jgi:hypothetical protein